jgi:Tfp pilus assembly protein PilO
MPTKSTKIKIVILLIINIIVWGFYVFAFMQIKNGENRMELLENTMRDNLKKQEVVRVLSRNLDETQINRDKLTDFILPKGGEVDFIKQIEDLVSKNHLKSEIKSVKIEPMASSSSLENLSIKLNVIGAWADVLVFQKVLESLPSVVVIDTFSISKFDTYTVRGDIIPQWNGSFDLKVAKIKE